MIYYYTVELLGITSYEDCTLLQNDTNNLIVRFKAWQLPFNFDKCEFLRITNKLHPMVSTYTMETNTITKVTSVKYLGIAINEKLQWSEHISKITNKANGTLSFLHRNLKYSLSNIRQKFLLQITSSTNLRIWMYSLGSTSSEGYKQD